MRKIFETWAKAVGEKFRDKQWLLSKWDCQEGIVWPQEKIELMTGGILGDLGISSGHRAADLGCGGGWISRELAGKCGRLIGVDFSPAMLEHARRINPEETFICASIGRLPFKDGAFERILCYFVLINFIDDKMVENGLRDIVRLLRPGGRALVGQLPDEEKNEVYDREKERYIQYCRREFPLADDLREVCRVPLRLFNRRKLEEILRPLNVSCQFLDSFNPFYRRGEPERISWRFDLLIEKK